MSFFDRYLHLSGTSPESSLLYLGSHSPWLVLLSVGIAIFAAYTALLVADFAERAEQGRTRNVLLTLGGVALGVGIWAMHFVGMLGFSLTCSVTYNPWVTGFSMIPGILASIFSLHVISRRDVGLRALILGGTLFGAGIGVMHYTGMAAMRMAALLRYDIKLFLLSIVVAVVLGILGLWIRFGLARLLQRSSRFSIFPAAIVMGGAVSGMHYTAMSAAYFVRDREALEKQAGADPVILAIIIAGVTGLLIGIVLIFVFRQIMKEMEKVTAESDKAMEKIQSDFHTMEAERWVKTHVAKIAFDMHQARNFSELGQGLLSSIAPLLSIGHATFYRSDETDNLLHLVASYACSDIKNLKQTIETGEGLIGQCAIEKARITMADLPQEYVRISTGLGDLVPICIVIQPVIHIDNLLGVLELAALQSFDDQAVALLDNLMPILAMNMEILKRTVSTEQLLEETRRQAENMEKQAARLEEQAVEMEAQQHAIKHANFLSDIALELTGCGYWHVDYSDPEYYYQSERAALILGEPVKPDGRYHLTSEWFNRLLEADEEAARLTGERYQGAIDGTYDKYDSIYAYKRPADGRIVWIHAVGKLVRDEAAGKILFMYGAYQDITEAKLAEDKLREVMTQVSGPGR